MYKPYYKGEEEVEEGTITEDRFLKCVKDPVVQLLPESTEPVVTIPYDGVGIDETTRMYLKQIFLLIIVIFILVNAIIFVKYLFKHFYAQKLLIIMIGREYLEGWIEKWETCNRSVTTDASLALQEGTQQQGQEEAQGAQGQQGAPRNSQQQQVSQRP